MGRVRKHESYTNSILTPIYQNTAYFYDDHETYVKALHEGSLTKGRYGRYHNPNWEEVEGILAQLDKAEDCLLFPSGMSAIYSTLMAFAKSQSCFATTCYLYKNTRRVFENLEKLGFKTLILDNSDLSELMRTLDQVSQDINILFLELPSNPHLYLADIEKIKELLEPDTLLVVDSTFASPYNFQPCLWGADLVIHSCTKYLNGHADVVLGSVAGKKEAIAQIRNFRNINGVIPSPRDVFTLGQHLKTFQLRMESLNASGQKLTEFLNSHDLVSKVYYLGLDSHPHRELSKKYFTNGYGGVVTFELKLSKRETSEFIDNLKIPYIASNFGSAETYIEQLAPFTYYYLSDQDRKSLNITDSLIRLSIGFNDPVDSIIEDLDCSLARYIPTEIH
ncbi:MULTISPECIES: PLP-dependent transferase [Moorena]|uniref:Cystathionine beta-lyase/cystathionine gamma-synthase n=1 Tax=Moorena producens 3L TaxID=489825 RepID=F4XJ88_9CYAN|nr:MULTISPECIES: PLP-dependent transferase [Moorena]EGJ35168.1 cystathionine beta-lyase/cystathionine gamma-synthase [Moorena producens 3L]NEP30105.1 aminotransferase class I/II-fold pyridoxal phosphate-dependent enzyme [Moorena sp. SIO3B2]NEP65056.1 aminotransferase class I/II-fold pyridoxal phosphate-dependent enzyme [Moorena sp. SIO3A5]NEQ06726.1 aminotransferase class I/II-fold pyridoxal phosphate-dependent enzyme [Moorena sp. SIO4E2]NER91362.1 aminotransferase class I/II-fold pyridoxal ph